MRENLPTVSCALAIEVPCVDLTIDVSFSLAFAFGCSRGRLNSFDIQLGLFIIKGERFVNAL